MKLFTCKCLPDGLEFACVVVAEDEAQARKIAKKEIESQEAGWKVTLEEIKLEEMEIDKPGARIIDPLNDYDEINGNIFKRG